MAGRSNKKNRHEAILRIIREQEIDSQEALTAALTEEGFSVTQATASRDIRDLGLVKSRKSDGTSRYVATEEQNLSEKYVRVLRDGYVSMDQAQNILVVKTVSGMAMAVAAALDAMNFPEIVGCIAGDDTIMAAVRTTEETTALKEQLGRLLKGE